MNRTTLRNWLILVAVVALAIGAILSSREWRPTLPLPLLAKEEKEWNHIDAGNRIEEASGFDVLHIGFAGGETKREEIAPIVELAVAVYFGIDKEDIREDLNFKEDLGATPEDMKGLAKLVEEGVEALTRYHGYITRTASFLEGLETVRDLTDHATDVFSASVGWLGATPRFHIGIIWKQIKPERFAGYAVTITHYENGEPVYAVLEPGEYAWEPDTEEDLRLQWGFWTVAKLEWYKKNALFPPGKFEQADKAVRHLLDYVNAKEHVGPLINAAMSEAFYYEQMTGEKWSFVEISYIELGAANMAPGVGSSGKPGYIAYRPVTLMGSRVFFRLRPTTVHVDERHSWIERDDQLNRVFVHEKRELTTEEIREILNSDNATYFQAGMTIYGPLGYSHGFNHPWLAEDMSS